MPWLQNPFKEILHREELSPERQKEYLEQYLDDLGLGKAVTFGAQAYADYDSKRIKSHTDFKTSFGKDGEGKEITLNSVLKGKAQELKEIFTPKNNAEDKKIYDAYIEAKNKYEYEIRNFKALLSKVPEKYSVADLRGTLEAAQQDARKAIEAQQMQERKNLEKLLNTDSFITQLTSASGLTKEKVKKDLLDELDKSHKTQLDEFNENTRKNLTKLDEASASEMNRLIFTAQLLHIADTLNHKEQQEMLREIERVRQENKNKLGIAGEKNVSVTFGETKKDVSFPVDPNDLHFIRTLSGKKIEQKDGVWTLNLSHRIFAPLYYAGGNATTDMMLMALAVRASGFDGITMTIEFKDEKTRIKRAKEAYEACLNAGFEPEKIKINVTGPNGKPMTIDEIFADKPSKLQQLNENSKQTRAKLAALKDEVSNKKSNPEKVIEARNELKALKEQELGEQKKKQPANTLSPGTEQQQTLTQ